ncbi:hypothetical protein BD626DRAFT_557691 [Schizophyllum amplum]|uniref:DUF1365-domain-containing protein n=1 Tax=Schizophyllum amplum TaxID=97359 RepID=A0A550CES1_9AGAR|nr:hypothetical protein BD626DRAFT_557691 [Auriculariopsis ampla]
MPTPVDIALSLLAVASVALFAYNRPGAPRKPHKCAYVLSNSVTHARLLPVESSHAFTYPTISFFVSLAALEAHELDLGPVGVLFSYGRVLGTMVGLRAEPYLREGNAGIRAKLDALLRERGILREDSRAIEDVINPLTIYFVYARDGGMLWLTVLEIHNTFGESHVHVLESGVNEDDATLAPGYTHQWTFPRAFHVSPFNSRAGFYTVSVKAPSSCPTVLSAPPRPAVRVHLHIPHSSDPTKPGDLKLTALLRATKSDTLSSSALLRTLARAPFALLLSMARISYQAWILHYAKRLDEGMLERQARRVLERFLHRRVEELGVAVSLVPADPDDRTRTFCPTKPSASLLEVCYLTPRFFTLMLAAPSAEHALLVGHQTEHIFTPSSTELFIRVFASPTVSGSLSLGQRIRRRAIPRSLDLPIPTRHFLETEWLATTLAAVQVLLDDVERRMFSLVRARVVPGDEPWLQWDRAAEVHRGGEVLKQQDVLGVGSVRNN